jgi:hypothetical protein
MKWLLFCLAAGVLPAAGEPREAPVATITLYTHFQQDPPEAVLEAIQTELESIMSPMGLHFRWRDLSAASGSEVSIELAVVNFKGECEVTSRGPHIPRPGALGWTHVSDGSILPFGDVDCDRIGSFVRQGLMAMDRDDREEAFGRAVGRVLAHELYHIFANTARHGSAGVGKAAYTVRELLCDEFQFEERESRALRTSRAHAALGIDGSAP